MPLSEHEQRLLDQIERALYAEDPKFASTVRGSRLRRPTRRRRLRGIVVFVAGLVLLVLGVVLPVLRPVNIPIVSVIGFLLMFGGAVFTLTSGGSATRGAGSPGAKGDPAGGRTRERGRFTTRMEERFRRRFDQEP